MITDKLQSNEIKYLKAIDSNGNKVEVMYRGDNLDIAMGRVFEILNEKENNNDLL